MRIRFDGKTVVVSGVGHGFGRCIAETFAQLGARVFGCDLSAPELAETAKAEVETEVLDLTDRGFRKESGSPHSMCSRFYREWYYLWPVLP